MSTKVAPGSIDMVLTDLPYGSTDNQWDIPIPLDKLWNAWSKVLKPTGVIALTAIQPYSSMLVMSKLDWFRHEWIWSKNKASNYVNAKTAPMRSHESVLIFTNHGSGSNTYNPQKDWHYLTSHDNKEYWSRHVTKKTQHFSTSDNWDPNAKRTRSWTSETQDMYVAPRSVQFFNSELDTLHPTQKPVIMFEHFIKTYTNKGDTVLDCCAGSGTTAIACINTKRNFILIEKSAKYCNIIKDRIQKRLTDSRPQVVPPSSN